MTDLERKAAVEEAWARRIVFADSLNDDRLSEWRGRWAAFYAVEVRAVPTVIRWRPRLAEAA